MLGFLLQWPTLLTALMFPILVFAYTRLARAEERDALAHFGQEYRRYMEVTPAFLPRRRRGLVAKQSSGSADQARGA